MDVRERIARQLATALLSGAWVRTSLIRRAALVLGRGAPKSLTKLIDDVLAQTVTPDPPSPDRLVAILLASPAFDEASGAAQRRIGSTPPAPTIPGPWDTSLPRPLSAGDLMAWLGISLSELDWFADERRQHVHAVKPALQHYSYAWVPRRTGAPRLIEAPKTRLKEIQRRILRDILDHIPVHDAAHGFVRGRSCVTAATPHGGECVVVTVDLKDFFLNTRMSRVHGVFRSVGCPWSVARLLTGLCGTTTPATIFDGPPNTPPQDSTARERFGQSHLPQGAPTSPALANLCAWRLDCRLTGLARRMGARYTRYADDLTFSGDEDFARRLAWFLGMVAAIVKDEGFALNEPKTRVMRTCGRQRVTGLVVNQHVNVPRPYYDTLKATLHNCACHGPDGQNRDGHADFRSHLNGRVTWVENVNPRRGLKLRRVFETIPW